MKFDPARQKEFLSLLKDQAPEIGDTKMDISFKSGFVIIELMGDASTAEKDFTDVTPEYLKLRFDESVSISKRIMERISRFGLDGNRPHRYTIFANGSRDNVWLKTYSDMTFLYKERNSEQSEILQTNISYLNRILIGKGEVIVNSIKHGKVGANLYMLGQSGQVGGGEFPTNMVLEMNISDVKTSQTYGEGSISVAGSNPYSASDGPEKRLYQTRQNYLINLLAIKSKLLELFIIQSDFLDIKKGELENVEKRGKGLRDEIYRLQNDINEHMKLYTPKESPGRRKKKKEKDFLAKESYEKEKELLTTASVKFSLVSEVEHDIMRRTSTMQELDQRTRDVAGSLSLESIDLTLEGLGFSLSEITRKEMDKDRRGLTSLLEELAHSRDILSSTIEVLRTFIDTRQREVSEDMSRLMNLLFLVFACIGLADALGNFVILVLDRGYLNENPSLMEVFQYGSLGMILTLLPLLIAAVFLYMFFKKKN
jgi:hypothetical protein